MKTILKSLLILVALTSTAATAYTADQCKKDGGTWAAGPLNFGTCTFKITSAMTKKPPGNPISNITAERCKELKGEINAAGDCVVPTKNMMGKESPKDKS